MIKENIGKVFRAIFVGIGAFLLCCVLAAGIMFMMGTYNKYIFSSENWREYPDDRINMVKSMESQYDFIGMSQADVINLLGKPNYTNTKEECEYIDLAKCDFDEIAQYQLNKYSRSIMDMIDKNYVVAYKDGKVVYADVLIAD